MGGHSQTYHVDVGLAGICTVIACEAHGHAKYANTKGVWDMPTQEILKKYTLRLNLRVL